MLLVNDWLRPLSLHVSCTEMRPSPPEAAMEKERISRTTGQPAPCGAAKRGKLGLPANWQKLRNKFLPILENQSQPRRNQEWAREALGIGRHLCVCLSCQSHFACFSWEHVCGEHSGYVFATGRSPVLLSSALWEAVEVAVYEEHCQWLMRIFHDFWMFAELTAFETQFQG